MPKFRPGQVVKLKEYSMGWIPANLKVVLVYEEDHMGCMLCDDPECVEWSNVLGTDGHWYWHVSECQMEAVEGWEA